MLLDRELILDLPPGQSAFLWGARKTGKSTYLKKRFPDAPYYDLLKSDTFFKYLEFPYLFREEVKGLPEEILLNHPIIIDEVQKVPILLDEIHWLIENTQAQFILCGSSARKLKRGAANLLGGRAWRYTFYPLVTPEIHNFDLLKALNHGLIPTHYLQVNPKRTLKAYIQDYLKEEIQAEGLTRNLRAFIKFLDSLGYNHGGLINYANISRECGVDAHTVKEYYQILVDTLLGYFLEPYKKRNSRKDLVSTPKFYLFDVGVANYLAKNSFTQLKGPIAGQSFEHFLFMEIYAYNEIREKDFTIKFWRDKQGNEVDFVLNEGEYIIEAKIQTRFNASDYRGLTNFMDENKVKKAFIVSLVSNKRKVTVDSHSIEIWPWKDFLERMWADELI